MKKTILFTLFLSLIVPQVLFAQDFSGTYSSKETRMAVILNLTQVQGNSVIGILAFDGIEYSLKGRKNGDQVAGVLTDGEETLKFSATLQRQDLILTIADSTQTETIVFTRHGSEAAAAQSGMKAAYRQGRVMINGHDLSNAEMDELEAVYGFRPLPGNYWYDSFSGLYGVMGLGANGFMFADTILEIWIPMHPMETARSLSTGASYHKWSGGSGVDYWGM